MVVAICFSAGLVFHSMYYDLVYVSGTSMYPNLNGDEDEGNGSLVDFGIVDSHKSAIKNIKRFSIVSTYYSTDYLSNGSLIPNPKQKIKRVIALPGETFKIEESVLYVLKDGVYEEVPYTFKIEPAKSTDKDVDPLTLGEDEYWVLGDQRNKSHDCGSSDVMTPVKKSYLLGVLVAIEGRAQLEEVKKVCNKCGATVNKNATKCSTNNCDGSLSPVYDLKHKQYHWPKYF